MNRRKLVMCSTLLAVMTMAGSSTAMAQKVDQWVDDVHYEMINGEVVVTEAKIRDGIDLVLLDEITADDGLNYPVTVIGRLSFSGNSYVKSIKGNNITRMEYKSFYGNDVESFDFPKLRWMENGCFFKCFNLKSLNFPYLVGTDKSVSFMQSEEVTSVTFGPMVQDLRNFRIYAANLMYLACYATTPPMLNNTFYEVDYTMPVHVPEQSIGAYRSNESWRVFTNFVPTDKWQLKLASSNDELGTCLGAGNYAPEAKVTIVAVPSQIGKFKAWSDGNTENPRVLTMENDMKLTAIFQLDQKIAAGSPDGMHTAIIKKDGEQVILDNSSIESIEWHEVDKIKQR